MKKLTLLFVAAMVLSLVGCKGLFGKKGKSKAKAKADTTEVVAPATAKKDVLRTPDLEVFNLQGPVQKAENVLENYNVTFDEQGRLTSISLKNHAAVKLLISYASNPDGKVTSSGGHKVSRDKDGRILSVSAGEGCGDAPGFYFSYKKGKLDGYYYASGDCSGDLFNEVHGFDDQGRVSKAKSGWGDEYGSEETTTTYNYTATDDWGNWTARTAKHHTVSSEWGDVEEEVTTTSDKTEKETRTITYY